MTKPTDAQYQAVSTLASNFKTADADVNGMLSQEELQALAQQDDASPELKNAAATLADPANKSAFDSADSANNGEQDGLIGERDMRHWLAAQSPQFDPAKNPLDEHTATFLAARYFDTWDGSVNKDNDDLIDRGELTAVRDNTDAPNEQRYAAQYLLDHPDAYDKLDTRNGAYETDGAIAKDDIKTVFGENLWDDAHHYTEGAVKSRYNDTPAPPSADTLPLSEENRALFASAQEIEQKGGERDANGDGQLSREESQLDEAVFEQLANADGTPGDGQISLANASATLLTASALNSRAAAAGASEQDIEEARAFSQYAAGSLAQIRDEATQDIDAQLAKIQTTGDLDTPGALSGAMQLVLDKWRPESSGDTIFQALDTVESGLDNADRAQFGKALEHLRWALDNNDVDEGALQEAVATRNTAQAMIDALSAADGVRNTLTGAAPAGAEKADSLARAYLEDQITEFGAPLSSDYVLAGMVASGQIQDPANLTEADLAKVHDLALKLANDSTTRDPALEKAAEYMKAYDPQLKDTSTEEIPGHDLHQRLRWEMGLEQANAVAPENYDYMSFLSGGDDATDAQLFYYNSVANQLKTDHPDLGRDKYTTESTKPTFSFSAVSEGIGLESSDEDLPLEQDEIDFLNQYTSDNQLDLSNGDDRNTLQDAWRHFRADKLDDDIYLYSSYVLEVSESQNPSVGQTDNLSVLADAARQANRTFDENGRPQVMDPYAMAAQMAARTELRFNDEGIPSVTTKDASMTDSEAIGNHVLIADRDKQDNQLWDLATVLSESAKALEGMAAEVEGVDPNQSLSTAEQIALGIACPIASLVTNIFSKPHFNEKQQWVHDQLEANHKSTDALDDALGQARSDHAKSVLIEGVTLVAATVATVVAPGAAAALRSGLMAGKGGADLAIDIARGFAKGAAIAAGDLASPVVTLGGIAGKAAFKNISSRLADDVAEAAATSARSVPDAPAIESLAPKQIDGIGTALSIDEAALPPLDWRGNVADITLSLADGRSINAQVLRTERDGILVGRLDASSNTFMGIPAPDNPNGYGPVFKINDTGDTTLIEGPFYRSSGSIEPRTQAGRSGLDDSGNMYPAKEPTNPPDPKEPSIAAHVRGSDPAKSNSPYTSFSFAQGSKSYGDNVVVIDTERLSADIASGKVENVKIVEAQDILKELGTQVENGWDKLSDNLRGRLEELGISRDSLATDSQIAIDKIGELQKSADNRLSKGDNKKLETLKSRLIDLTNATRDNEVLIYGVIPSEYISVFPAV